MGEAGYAWSSSQEQKGISYKRTPLYSGYYLKEVAFVGHKLVGEVTGKEYRVRS